MCGKEGRGSHTHNEKAGSTLLKAIASVHIIIAMILPQWALSHSHAHNVGKNNASERHRLYPLVKRHKITLMKATAFTPTNMRLSIQAMDKY